MGKKVEEKLDLNIDEANELDIVEVQKPIIKKQKSTTINDRKELINCLSNTKVIVRFIAKAQGLWNGNKNHVLAGGMAENAYRIFVVPKLTSGLYVNVLTDSEKAFLEDMLGLEYNALSIYKKEDNFWDSTNDNGINKVRLTKQDTILDLRNPEDYIKYKILLANKQTIAPSLSELEDRPKASYQFVIIKEEEENKVAVTNMSTTMRCYKEFGKIEDDNHKLRTIIEIITGRPLSSKTKLEFLQTKINELIQADSKRFLRAIIDPTLDTKVLIKRCIEEGTIANRGGMLYLRRDNTPLCDHNEEPTLSIAAKYLNQPKNQEIKFYLEAQLK
jgi:hypothetical protein